VRVMEPPGARTPEFAPTLSQHHDSPVMSQQASAQACWQEINSSGSGSKIPVSPEMSSFLCSSPSLFDNNAPSTPIVLAPLESTFQRQDSSNLRTPQSSSQQPLPSAAWFLSPLLSSKESPAMGWRSSPFLPVVSSPQMSPMLGSLDSSNKRKADSFSNSFDATDAGALGGMAGHPLNGGGSVSSTKKQCLPPTHPPSGSRFSVVSSSSTTTARPALPPNPAVSAQEAAVPVQQHNQAPEGNNQPPGQDRYMKRESSGGMDFFSAGEHSLRVL